MKYNNSFLQEHRIDCNIILNKPCDCGLIKALKGTTIYTEAVHYTPPATNSTIHNKRGKCTYFWLKA